MSKDTVVAVEYEVLMSDIEHKEGRGIVVRDVDTYFIDLFQKDQKITLA